MLSQTVVIAFVACASAFIADRILTACKRKPNIVHGNWKPLGIYKGNVLYERTYTSGKKSWRIVKDGDGHIYMGISTLQNEIITPL